MDTSRLPVSMGLQPDESFSSWLARLAWLHGLKPRQFCQLVAGPKIEFNRDLDGPTAEQFLPIFAERTGQTTDRLRTELTLMAFNGRLYPEVRAKTATPWVLPLGGVTRRLPSLQFCPVCLSHPPAYFRRAWRLSLFAVCPAHACGLHHLCPQCGAVANPLKNRPSYQAPVLAFCWQCEHDLRRAPIRKVSEAEARTAYDCAKALYDGVVPSTGPKDIDAHGYFTVLAMLCARLVSRRTRFAAWRVHAARRAGVELPPPLEHHVTTCFDTLADPTLRSPVLWTASWLLQDWPDRFLAVAREAGSRTSDFTKVFADAPGWFLEPLRAQLTPVLHAASVSLEAMRLRRMRELVLSRRKIWSVNRRHRVVRALRVAGFYPPETPTSDILHYVSRTICRLREELGDYRLRATRQVARGTAQWQELLRLARPFRKDCCSTPEELQRGIHLLCKEVFLSAHDLSELLGRCRVVLKAKHLTIMVRAGRLETRFGENATGRRNHPHQAYRSIVHDASSSESPSSPEQSSC